MASRHIGNAVLGSRRPLSGAIRDLAVRPAGCGTAEVTWSFDTPNPTDYGLGVYVDGELAQRLENDQSQASLAQLAPGSHSVTVLPRRAGGGWPDSHGEPHGLRAYISWPRSADPAVIGHRVYWGPLTPTVLLATVTTVEVERRTQVFSDSGTGGRVSFSGNCTETVNLACVLSVTGTGTAQFEAAGETTDFDFGAGETVSLPYGVRITFHDPADHYGTHDEYTVHVGPAAEYISEQLAVGTYAFGIKAIDAADNESDLSGVRKLRIVASMPEPALSFAYDGDMAVSVSQSGFPDDGYWGVCTTWDQVTRTNGPHVIEDVPMGWLLFDEQQYVEVGGPCTVLFRAVTRDSNGAVAHGARVYAVNFPPTATDRGYVLSEPTNLRAEAVGIGGVKLLWDYAWRPGDSLTAFAYYAATTAGNVYSSMIDSARPTDITSTGYPVTTYSITFDASSIGWESGPVYLGVRSIATDTYSANTAVVSTTPVSAAPNAPCASWGAAQ